MTWQRYWAFTLIAIEALLLAYLSADYVFPALVTAFGALGALGRIQFDMGLGRRTLAAALIGAFLAAFWQSGIATPPHAESLLLDTYGHPVILYLMILQGGRLYLRAPAGVGAGFPLLAVAVMVCIGDLFSLEARQTEAYRFASLAFIAAFCAYLSAPTTTVARTLAAIRFHRLAMPAALVVLIAAMGWGSALLLSHYRHELDAAYVNMLRRVTDTQRAGFGTHAVLDGVTDLRLEHSQQTMLRVYGPESPGYLRGRAYDVMRPSEWSVGTAFSPLYPIARPDGLPPEQRFENTFRVRRGDATRAVSFDIWPTSPFDDVMFTRLDTGWISASADALAINFQDAVQAPETRGGKPYRIHCTANAPRESLGPSVRKRLTQQPKELHPGVGRLAESIFHDKVSDREKIAAVRQYMLENYEYALNAEIPEGQDPVTHFLLKRPQTAAHCEYFASGAALLLRIGGVPARYVTGFLVTERNPVADYWVARGKDAHAWVEAYVDGEGWVTVEATPPEGVPQDQQRTRLSYWWDSTRQRLWQFRRDAMAYARDLVVNRLTGILQPLSYLAVPAIIIALLLFIRGVRPARRGEARGRAPSSVSHLNALLAKADRRARRLGWRRSATETLHQFAHRLEADPADASNALASWYRAYAETRYRPAVDAETIDHLGAALNQTLRAVPNPPHD